MTSLLHSILRKTHDEIRPVKMQFLDLAKGLLSYGAIFEAARASGVPPPLTNYLKHLYKNLTVHMNGIITRCGRGVRQGDPLSPVLFILAMDEVIKAVIPEINFELDGSHIDAPNIQKEHRTR